MATNGNLVIEWNETDIEVEARATTTDGRFCAHLLIRADGQCAFAIVDESKYSEQGRTVFKKGFATKPDIDDLCARVCEDIMDSDPTKRSAARSLTDEREMLAKLLARI